MDFQVTGLPAAPFQPLFGLGDEALAARNVVRMMAEKTPTSGYPCRVCLRDVETSAPVLLLNYEHLPVETPYRSRHAIFVREYAEEASLAQNEIPEIMHTRTLSLRVFDRAGMMLEADLAQGRAAVTDLIGRLFDEPGAAYLHVHSARRGCYLARVDRAG